MKFAHLLCVVALVALTTTISAQECKKCPAAKTSTVSAAVSQQDSACTACKGTCDSACETCVVSDAMEKLPKMTFKVGTESTCCSQMAAQLAKKSEKPVHYVVGDKTFEKEGEAFVSLVETTEGFVKSFATPAKCEASGTTSIAGKSCACSVEAGKRAELVKAAISEVKMSYKVGKESTCCNASAAELVKKTGEKMTFVVAGKETCCNQTARLNLARAQYAAAVKALASNEKAAAPQATETKASSESKGS